MNLIELIIDDNEDLQGVEAISIVENPAIESNFVALKTQEIKLAEVDSEKRILMGAVLIPEKPIYRRNGQDEYYIYFSKETVNKASQLFFKNKNQQNWTLEHSKQIEGLTVVESWIVEDTQKDKSALYNLEVPVGTWMASVKVDDEQMWNEFVKTGKVKGFSLEGYFADKLESKKELSKELTEEEILIEKIKEIILKEELESYTDYPKQAIENAKIALRWAEENGWGDCGTAVGKIRANQLANGEPISKDTISRMASFERHRQNSDKELGDGCGRLMWLAWGGDAGIEWASRKLKELNQ
jgi:hypothetical protein